MSATSCAVCLAFLFSVSPAAAQQASAAESAIAQRFNKLYAAPSDLFSAKPNAFLARMITGLKPGRALDIAMGQGRNSIFLATQGWDVTGYDVADTGLEAARSGAEKARVRIDAV